MNSEDYEYDEKLGIASGEAVAAVGNRYDLVLIASRRVRELHRGDAAKLACRRGPVLTALKEIEFGKVGRNYLLKEQDVDMPKRRKK